MPSVLRSLQSLALKSLYPHLCPACTHPLESDAPAASLCLSCWNKIEPRPEYFCKTCGEPYAGDDLPERCMTCVDRRFAFEFASAPYLSRGILRHLIHRYKYDGHLYLRNTFAELLGRAWRDTRIPQSDAVLVPVPLHPRRRRERGFNQADELARLLSRQSALPVLPALKRTRYTTTQTSLGRKLRIANLKDAFRLHPRFMRSVKNKTVLLVDDVFTTGSTTHECATALRRANTHKVIVITLARG